MQSVDELLAEAEAQTGLHDFGEDSFREGLERLVRALREAGRAKILRGRVLWVVRGEQCVPQLVVADFDDL